MPASPRPPHAARRRRRRRGHRDRARREPVGSACGRAGRAARRCRFIALAAGCSVPADGRSRRASLPAGGRDPVRLGRRHSPRPRPSADSRPSPHSGAHGRAAPAAPIGRGPHAPLWLLDRRRRTAAIRALDREGAPTAVFALSDALASGVYMACAASIWTYPRSLSRFDDHPLSPLVAPPLTSVSWDTAAAAAAAASMLIGAIDDGRRMGEVVVPPRLHPRRSTAA